MKCCYKLDPHELCDNDAEPRAIYCLQHLNLPCEKCGDQAYRHYFIEPICKECDMRIQKENGQYG